MDDELSVASERSEDTDAPCFRDQLLSAVTRGMTSYVHLYYKKWGEKPTGEDIQERVDICLKTIVGYHFRSIFPLLLSNYEVRNVETSFPFCDDDLSGEDLVEMEKMNEDAVRFLNTHGFEGDALERYGPKKYRRGTKTSSDEAGFLARERRGRDFRLEELRDRKRKCLRSDRARSRAEEWIRETVRDTRSGKDPYREKDIRSLPVAMLKILYEWKHGTRVPKKFRKKQLAEAWKEARRAPGPPEWTDAHEEEMKKLETEEVRLKDT